MVVHDIGNVLRLCKQNSQVSSSISVLTDIETVLSYQSRFFSDIACYSTTHSDSICFFTFGVLVSFNVVTHSIPDFNGFDFMALSLLLDSVVAAGTAAASASTTNIHYWQTAPLSIYAALSQMYAKKYRRPSIRFQLVSTVCSSVSECVRLFVHAFITHSPSLSVRVHGCAYVLSS